MGTQASLPLAAQEILKRAANGKYRNEFERVCAIEAAICQVKRQYPQFFR